VQANNTPVFVPVVAPAGLSTAHVAGASFGGFVGAGIALVLARYGVNISRADDALIGGFVLSTGAGVGHVVAKYGVFPALKKLFLGRP
jgi:hypothetical protein